MKGWKVWVRTVGEKNFATNAMVYKTKEEAEEEAKDLFARWTAVEEWKVEEVQPEVLQKGEKNAS
jgi:hypothetical protein